MGVNPLPLFFHSSNSSVFEYVQSAHVSCGDSRYPYFLTVTVRQTPRTLTIWAGDINAHKLSRGLQGYNNVSSLHSFASSTNEERFGGKNCISQSLTSDRTPTILNTLKDTVQENQLRYQRVQTDQWIW